MQLADLLVQIGRGPEAIPVFLALADELAADGFNARAVAALKRIEKIERGRPEVEARLTAMGRRTPSMVPSVQARPVALPPPPREAPNAFEIGIEEVPSDTLSRLEAAAMLRAVRSEMSPTTSEDAASPASPEAETPEAAPAVETPVEPPAEPAPVETATVEPEGAGPAAAEPAPTEAATAEPVAGDAIGNAANEEAVIAAPIVPPIENQTAPPVTQPATTGVAHRLRGVFRRFLAALPVTAPASTSEPTPAAAEPDFGSAKAQAVTSEPETGAPDAKVAAPEAEAVAPEPEVVALAPEDLAPVSATAATTTLSEPTPVAVEPDLASVATNAFALVPEAVRTGSQAPDAEPDFSPAPPEGGTEDAAPEFDLGEPEPPLLAGEEAALEEDLPTLDLPDEPAAREATAQEHDEEDLPTLEVNEEAREVAVEATEPVGEPAALVESEKEATVVELEPLMVEAEPLTVEPEAVELQAPPAEPRPPAPGRSPDLGSFLSLTEDAFQDQVTDLIEGMLDLADMPAAGEASPKPARPLLTGPLFEGLADDERVALVRGLRLRTFEPGDILLTEGETGSSLFLITAGAAKVFVRNAAGHSLLLDSLGEGDFFGEISTLLGRPRTATVSAAAPCELLELDQSALAQIAVRYPHVAERLEIFSREHAGDPEAAALRVREAASAGETSAEFRSDEGPLESRMRLRLADAFLKAGQEREAAQVLIDLAGDLVRRGQHEKAVALLKKVEHLQRRPKGLARRAAGAAAPLASTAKRPPDSDDRLGDWLVDVVRDTVRRRQAVASRALEAPAGPAIDSETMNAYGRGLMASPLFEGLSGDELLALVQRLELRMYEPGDLVLTEGEPGQSVFIVASGEVRVFIRNRAGHDTPLRTLGEGAFFGEISALSERSRTASVTAATSCVLLELDPSALDSIETAHPGVREKLETAYIERASDPEAEAIRRQ